MSKKSTLKEFEESTFTPEFIEQCKAEYAEMQIEEQEYNLTVGLEEGDVCKRHGCRGIMYLPEVEGCQCHLCPPCSACVENAPVCSICGKGRVDDE